MAFFLETLLGGLMAGMLYSLVALGFVLIFKASGVFNFAQGAMVLFAALAMARFAEWIPKWTGVDHAQATGNHDGLVVTALHGVHAAGHALLVFAEVTQQVGPAKFVVEGCATQGAFDHDL